MRANQRLKTILTWTTMSLLVATTANAEMAFGFKQHDYNKKQAEIVLQQHIVEANLKRQLTCLARNVWYEAGHESVKGQLAVAQVTVNRARSSRWPDDLCAVVSQSTVTQEGKKVCQFSWYCDQTKNKNLPINERHPAYQAAYRVLVDGYRISVLGNDAYFFHNATLVQPSWPHQMIAQIGNHVFYKARKRD